jgi:hypothetical protein
MLYPCATKSGPTAAESLRLEAVTTCVGFDDMLDVTLTRSHPHLDTMIVVTSHSDTATKRVCGKHGVICVQTDLFVKNGRSFNKGAAINAGFARFQYYGWRLHLDADIVLPDNFRRILFNHSYLDQACLYGADRVNALPQDLKLSYPQHHQGCLVNSHIQRQIGARFVHGLHGYCPIGYFQLWHCSCQKPYPYSLGTAEHDDVMFAMQWPESQRRLLPGVIVSHLVSRLGGAMGENWDGRRREPRLEEKR